MSLNINGERLLAEALADAMDRDLADVPEKEQLEKQHRFSKKFVRRIKRIEKGIETGDETEPERRRDTGDRAGTGQNSKADRKLPRIIAPGKKARRYGGMAAALVCIIGLTAFLGVMGRMGASEGDGAKADMAMDGKAETQNEASIETEGPSDAPADEAADAPADDMAGMPEDNDADAPADAPADDAAEEPSGEPADLEESVDFAGEPAAPGWQEQLLAESEKADELISWHLADVYDGTSFVLESELVNSGKEDGSTAPLVSASLIYEVYYRESADEWVRVYRTDRSMSQCEPRTVWGDEYLMQELNMTKPGTYRVVRQVNSYRQVLELSLEQI